MDTELSKDPLDESDPGYQKPEPKEEGPVNTHNTQKTNKEGGDKKTNPGDAPSTKSRRRYNDPTPGKGGNDKDEEKKDGSGKQRQGRNENRGKHEDEKDNNQSKKDHKDPKHRGKKEN